MERQRKVRTVQGRGEGEIMDNITLGVWIQVCMGVVREYNMKSMDRIEA